MSIIITDLANTVGMIGVVMTLVAYYLLNVNKLASTDLTYLFMNFVGSFLVTLSLLVYWNLSALILEAAWAVFSLIGVYRVLRAREAKKTEDMEIFYSTKSPAKESQDS